MHPRTGILFAVALAAVSLGGCRAKQLGAIVSDTSAATVDHGWIVAARHCWPALHDTNDKMMDANLADPIHFRAVFPVYATFTDTQVESIAGHAIDQAPDPDLSVLRNASSPILTRTQSMSAAGAAGDPTTQSLLAPRDAITVPADALCAVHAGTPVGFK